MHRTNGVRMSTKTTTTSDASHLLARSKKLLGAGNALCVVGYPLSGESGAPHFHDIVQGVWSRLSSTSRINPFVSPSDYKLVMDWFEGRKRLIERRAKQKPFLILKELAQVAGLAIVSQCVDGQIRRNGFDADELFGNVFEAICFDNGHVFPNWTAPQMDSEGHLLCPDCGSRLFPNVSMFGWNKKEELRKAVANRVAKARILMLVGTDPKIAPFSDLLDGLPTNIPVLEILVGAIVLTENNQREVLAIVNLRKNRGTRPESPEAQSYEGALHDLCWEIQQ